MKLNRELAEMAKKNGICEDWYKELRTTEDIGKLLKMYLNGIDFCLSNEYPPLPFIRKHFVGTMEAFGIFLDEKITARNSKYVVALGSCTGEAEYTDFAVGEVFVKHSSKLTIKASGNAFVMVDVFDETEVEVIASGNAKVCVNQYGGNLTTTTEDETGSGKSVIKVIHKQTKTY